MLEENNIYKIFSYKKCRQGLCRKITTEEVGNFNTYEQAASGISRVLLIPPPHNFEKMYYPKAFIKTFMVSKGLSTQQRCLLFDTIEIINKGMIVLLQF